MISMTAVAIGFAGMIALLFLGLHVATALFLTAVLAIQIYFGGSLLSVYGTQLWSAPFSQGAKIYSGTAVAGHRLVVNDHGSIQVFRLP